MNITDQDFETTCQRIHYYRTTKHQTDAEILKTASAWIKIGLTEKDLPNYTRYGTNYLTSGILLKLIIKKVPRKEMEKMTIEECLTWIHLFGE